MSSKNQARNHFLEGTPVRIKQGARCLNTVFTKSLCIGEGVTGIVLKETYSSVFGSLRTYAVLVAWPERSSPSIEVFWPSELRELDEEDKEDKEDKDEKKVW